MNYSKIRINQKENELKDYKEDVKRMVEQDIDSFTFETNLISILVNMKSIKEQIKELEIIYNFEKMSDDVLNSI